MGMFDGYLWRPDSESYPRYTKSLANTGVNELATLLGRRFFTALIIPEQIDLGVDVTFHLPRVYGKEGVTSRAVGAQVKSGDSWFSSDRRASFSVDEKHRDFWMLSLTPILAFAYREGASDGDGYFLWGDIRNQLRAEPRLKRVTMDRELIDEADWEHLWGVCDSQAQQSELATHLLDLMSDDIEKQRNALQAVWFYSSASDARAFALLLRTMQWLPDELLGSAVRTVGLAAGLAPGVTSALADDVARRVLDLWMEDERLLEVIIEKVWSPEDSRQPFHPASLITRLFQSAPSGIDELRSLIDNPRVGIYTADRAVILLVLCLRGRGAPGSELRDLADHVARQLPELLIKSRYFYSTSFLLQAGTL
ncbi:DUF4365 domain-containing protein [Motilibacter deserti]|uniref:DUF4365 domain-containing protein n=1 Tax=Motilibacter deserti TaxID=2714956 RepID=A0ABX0GXH1_9ACTN|nr:DUF4365 domain-containing protein [Motilibacter deserti]NHC15671.1 DUF4365 domain-containing protein [Motilibacter deserti]